MITAQYSDGRSAASIPVSVWVWGDSLRIEVADGSVRQLWPLAQIPAPMPLPKNLSKEPLILKLQPLDGVAASYERLTFTDPAMAEEAMAILGPFWKQSRTTVRQRWLSALAVVWLLAVGVWFGLPLAARALAPLVPQHWEAVLGENTRQQMAYFLSDDTVRWITLDPVGQEILDRLVDRLEHSGVNGLVEEYETPLRIHILDASLVNAFALPGNMIVITTGLLEDLESLDELAGVLAHERAHIRQRHVMQQLIRRMVFQLIADLMTGGSSGAGKAVGQYLIVLDWSREMEREADSLGLETLRAARISPQGFQNFFLRLAKDDQDMPLEDVFSSHPGSAERAALVRALEAYPVEALYGEAQWRQTWLRGRAPGNTRDAVIGWKNAPPESNGSQSGKRSYSK